MATVSKAKRTRRFLADLARSTSGNSMIIVAAAMVPIAGVVGGGFDMGRAYLAKSKLQAACDAGALAGRRTMLGTAWNAAASTAANAYFGVNFVNGKYGTTGLTKTFSSPDGEKVSGTAAVNVPTTLMKIFGTTQVPVNVTCEAIMSLPNSDVMFVLDTTGSMATVIPTDGITRIAAMRTAIKGFYDAVEAAKSVGTQVRYGFVPYSSNVNVGRLLRNEWVVDNWTYQSRAPAGSTTSTSTVDTENWLTWFPTANPAQTFNTVLTGETCAPVGHDTLVGSGWSEIPAYPRSTDPTTGRTIIYYREFLTGSQFYANLDASTGICTQTEYRYTNSTYMHKYEIVPAGTAAATNMWDYKPVSYNVSSLKGGAGFMVPGSITATVGNGQTSAVVPWDGCIEERNTIETNSYPSTLPATLADMDVDTPPIAGNTATQWRPSLPGLVFMRIWEANLDPAPWLNRAEENQSMASFAMGTGAACPSPARKLAQYGDATTRSELFGYIDSLNPIGGTHHDIGMIWGLRLMSAQGLFQSENATTPAGNQITRHLVLMTDGETDARVTEYDAYGLAGLDQRRYTIPSGESQPTSNAALNSIVAARFSRLCDTAKSKGITVWTIAFGTPLTTMLRNCASAPENAYDPTTATSLSATFAQIAGKISNLRLKR